MRISRGEAVDFEAGAETVRRSMSGPITAKDNGGSSKGSNQGGKKQVKTLPTRADSPAPR